MGDTKKRLLVIEDDPALMELMLDYCEIIDCAPLPAETGGEGLAKASAEKPDAITVDHRLPDMTGLDVIKRLKADPATKDIPVVFLSADAKLHETEAKHLGAFGVLLKPVSPAALRTLLVGALGDW